MHFPLFSYSPAQSTLNLVLTWCCSILDRHGYKHLGTIYRGCNGCTERWKKCPHTSVSFPFCILHDVSTINVFFEWDFLGGVNKRPGNKAGMTKNALIKCQKCNIFLINNWSLKCFSIADIWFQEMWSDHCTFYYFCLGFDYKKP